MKKTSTRRSYADNVPRSLASIMQDRTITIPKTLVTGVIIEKSSTLLFAREKAGKTTFITTLMNNLAAGRPVFGQESSPQTVLLASLEEPLHLVKMRAKDMGIPADTPIQVLRSVQHPTKSPLQVLEEAIVLTGATVVVIDTLSAYAVGQISGENSAAAWSALLYPLMALPSKLGFALVVVHHATKGGLDFRGNTAIGAVVDNIVSLSKPKGAPPNVRALGFTGRLGCGELMVARHPETGDYDIVDSESVPVTQARGSMTEAQLADRILKARQVDGGATKETLRKAGGVKATRSDAVIDALLADGRLLKTPSKGGYRYVAA